MKFCSKLIGIGEMPSDPSSPSVATWSRAKKDFDGTFQDVILPRLPFDRNVAHMLAVLAERVDDGVVPYEQLPRNYRTAFIFVTLAPDALVEARQRGLVHPGVKGQDVEAFRRELGRRALKTGRRRRLARILQEKLERLRRETEAVKSELANLGFPVAEGEAVSVD